jgi:hypothetical protein
VVFTDGFPTTATGKVRRVELRKMAATVLNPGSEASVSEAGVSESDVSQAGVSEAG